MFEIVPSDRKPTLRERVVQVVREAVDPDRCALVTRAEQLGRALFFAALGAILTSFAIHRHQQVHPAPVHLLPPKVEQVGDRLKVLELGFEHRGAVSKCRLVIFHNDSHDWSLQC